MRIIWLGHSCFAMEQDGYRIVTDPYRGVEGYPDLQTTAQEVFCSHEHFDHNCREAVTLVPGGGSPFTVREIASFHDDAGGTLRGENTIRCFTAGGYTVCHLGDLGHLLSKEQVEAIGKVDVLLIPVGGFYTVGPEEAKQVIRQLNPRCAVPMHYRHTPYGLPNIGTVEAFLSLFCSGDVVTLPGDTLEVEQTLPAIAVPTYRRGK